MADGRISIMWIIQMPDPAIHTRTRGAARTARSMERGLLLGMSPPPPLRSPWAPRPPPARAPRPATAPPLMTSTPPVVVVDSPLDWAPLWLPSALAALVVVLVLVLVLIVARARPGRRGLQEQEQVLAEQTALVEEPSLRPASSSPPSAPWATPGRWPWACPRKAPRPSRSSLRSPLLLALSSVASSSRAGSTKPPPKHERLPCRPWMKTRD